MKRLIVSFVFAASIWTQHPAVAYEGDSPRCSPDGYDESGQCYDQNYGSRDDKNRNRDRNRGAFSPGPFDRSPVDIHDNQVCISPDCSSGKKRNNDEG